MKCIEVYIILIQIKNVLYDNFISTLKIVIVLFGWSKGMVLYGLKNFKSWLQSGVGEVTVLPSDAADTVVFYMRLSICTTLYLFHSY